MTGDRPSRSLEVGRSQSIGSGFCSYDRFLVARADHNGMTQRFERDVLRSGKVVGILPVDPGSQEIVLIRQFRLGGHLATARGEMIEIPAGRVEAGETLEQAARRECLEETGLIASSLDRLFEFLPAPALTDEIMTVFLAIVAAGESPGRAGVTHEGEDVEVIRYPIDTALELVAHNQVTSGPTIVSLQWLALNRQGLGDLTQR